MTKSISFVRILLVKSIISVDLLITSHNEAFYKLYEICHSLI
jgi:hypothetical protein